MSQDEIRRRAALPFCCRSHRGTMESAREHIPAELTVAVERLWHAVADLLSVYRALIADPEISVEERAELYRRLEQIEGVYLTLSGSVSWLALALHFAIPEVPAREAPEPKSAETQAGEPLVN